MATQLTGSGISYYRNVDEKCLAPYEAERMTRMQIGDSIRVTSGALWVTQEGDREDHVLRRGDEFVMSRRGLVVVQALDEGACNFSKN